MAYYERTDSPLTGSDMRRIALSRISLAHSSEIAPGWLVSRLYPMHCTSSLKLFGTAASGPWGIKRKFLINVWKPESLHRSCRWILSSLEWSRSPKWIFHIPRSQTYWWTSPALRVGCPPENKISKKIRFIDFNCFQNILNMGPFDTKARSI